MRIRPRDLSAAILATSVVAGAARAGIQLRLTAPHAAPPAARSEHPGVSPFRDAVWVDGRWDWRAGQYVWIAGHWQKAPAGRHRWQNGWWSEHKGFWFFSEGHWL